MTERNVEHASLTVERTYPATPQQVFRAWATESAKDRWFGSGDTEFLASTDEYTLDFRVGGLERLAGTLAGGRTFEYLSFYQDIVEDQRIVASYAVLVDDRRWSVSLTTVEIMPSDGGTHLILTEQGAFLDGHDTNDERRKGVVDMLNKLGAYLGSEAAGRVLAEQTA